MGTLRLRDRELDIGTHFLSYLRYLPLLLIASTSRVNMRQGPGTNRPLSGAGALCFQRCSPSSYSSIVRQGRHKNAADVGAVVDLRSEDGSRQSFFFFYQDWSNAGVAEAPPFFAKQDPSVTKFHIQLLISDFTKLISFLSGTRGLEELHLKNRREGCDVLPLHRTVRLWAWDGSTFDKEGAHARPAGRVVIPLLWRTCFVRSDFRTYKL